jgi:hypothetical protein
MHVADRKPKVSSKVVQLKEDQTVWASYLVCFEFLDVHITPLARITTKMATRMTAVYDMSQSDLAFLVVVV